MTTSDEHGSAQHDADEVATDTEVTSGTDAQPDAQPDTQPDAEEWASLAVELREVFDAIDPVPPEVEAVAYGALAWRDVDAELAELVADSTDADAPVAVRRSGILPRLVTFQCDDVSIEVEVAKTGRTRSILGQLIPVGQATVEVQTPDDATSVVTDELGRFVLEDVSAGPVRLTCVLDGERRVVTSWTSI